MKGKHIPLVRKFINASVNIWRYFHYNTDFVVHKEVFWKEYDKCTAYSLATLDMIEEGKPPYKIFLWIDMDNNVLELEGDLLWEHRDNLMKIIGY